MTGDSLCLQHIAITFTSFPVCVQYKKEAENKSNYKVITKCIVNLAVYKIWFYFLSISQNILIGLSIPFFTHVGRRQDKPSVALIRQEGINSGR